MVPGQNDAFRLVDWNQTRRFGCLCCLVNHSDVEGSILHQFRSRGGVGGTDDVRARYYLVNCLVFQFFASFVKAIDFFLELQPGRHLLYLVPRDTARTGSLFSQLVYLRVAHSAAIPSGGKLIGILFVLKFPCFFP